MQHPLGLPWTPCAGQFEPPGPMLQNDLNTINKTILSESLLEPFWGRVHMQSVLACAVQTLFSTIYLNQSLRCNKKTEGQDRGTNSHATRKQRPSQINTREAVLKPTILGRPPLGSSCRKQVLKPTIKEGPQPAGSRSHSNY